MTDPSSCAAPRVEFVLSGDAVEQVVVSPAGGCRPVAEEAAG